MDVESLVRGIMETSTTPAASQDLPPKYEDLEELPPPQYNAVVAETPVINTQDGQPQAHQDNNTNNTK